jgi:hypothetical protein
MAMERPWSKQAIVGGVRTAAIRMAEALFVAVAVSLVVAGALARADANAFHGYSIARESTGSGFTGVHVYRIDQAVQGQPATGPLCGFWVAAISWRAGQGAGQC